ncbi:hypothetical protein AB0I77_51915, partial [Streptomyces sp. NPDC050619]
SDDKGRLYGGDLEHNSLWRRNPNGTYRTLAQGSDLLWVDTLSVTSDRHPYASPISWSACRSTPAGQARMTSPARVSARRCGRRRRRGTTVGWSSA